MNKWFFVLLLGMASQGYAEETCGRVTLGSLNAQFVLKDGTVVNSLKKNDLLPCGVMLTTQTEPVWIELADLSVYRIAPQSFMEFSGKSVFQNQLYRGSVFVSAPTSIPQTELMTPNASTEFKGGVLMLKYNQLKKETTLACFGKSALFRNKFKPEANRMVSAGEISRFWLGHAGISPRQPELINPSTLKIAFQGFFIPDQQIEELAESVQRVIESRSRSMVADLESWEEIEHQSSEGEKQPHRTIASFSGKEDPSSIDAKEAAWVLGMMKKRLFGDEEDDRIFKEETRQPASIRQKIKDVEYERKKANRERSLKKVYEEIRNFDPEND